MHTRSGAVLLTGMMLGLSFPPLPFPFLACVALVPLLPHWDAPSSFRARWGVGFMAFLICFAISFSWPLFHHLPHVAVASVSGVVILPLFLSLPLPVAGLIRDRMGRAWGLSALVATWLVMEAVLQRGPWAFPWVLLGHSQAETVSLIQFADLTGVAGVTLWVLLLNIASWRLTTASGHRRLPPLMGLALLLLGAWAYGQYTRSTHPAPRQYLSALLVQPALSAPDWADLHATSRVDTLMRYSTLREPVPPISLMVWPETALPPYRQQVPPDSLHGLLQAWVEARGAALLTGAIGIRETTSQALAYVNRALLLQPHTPPTTYDKRHLVPFAEAVPFADRLPWLQRLGVAAGGVAQYHPGSQPPVITVDGIPLGLMICFESLFGNHARQAVEQGAEALMVLTQDGWWGPSFGYHQHLAFNRLRAIETRRAVAQASVSGMTALIHADGTVAAQMGWMERGSLLVPIPLHRTSTVYTRWGDWLSALALAFVAFMITVLLVRRKP